MRARILAYHRLCDEPSPALRTWSVRPAVFRRQMRLLRRLGYRGVPVRKLLDTIEAGETGEKLVGLSFDDGYRDTVELGLPILEEIGFAASVYIVSDSVGARNGWEADGGTVPLASWPELRSLGAAGWEIGMHSRSHPARLDLLTGDDLESQVSGGLQRVRDELSTPVNTFAYPHGRYSDETLAVIERAGYRAGLTTDPGAASAESPRFALPRYEIKRRDTLVEIAILMLTGVLPRRREALARFHPSRWRASARGGETSRVVDDEKRRSEEAA